MTNTLKLNERKEKRKTSKLKLTWYYIKILKANLRNRCIERNHAIQKKEIKMFNIIFGKASIPVDFKENLKKVTHWYKRLLSYPFCLMCIIRMFKLVHISYNPFHCQRFHRAITERESIKWLFVDRVVILNKITVILYEKFFFIFWVT